MNLTKSLCFKLLLMFCFGLMQTNLFYAQDIKELPSPGKIPKSNLFENFELIVEIETDAEGAIIKDSLAVTNAEGDKDGLIFSAEMVDILLGRTTIPDNLKKIGFGKKVKMISTNQMIGNDGEINFILESKETPVTDEKKIGGVIKEVFALQMLLPKDERLLLNKTEKRIEKDSIWIRFLIDENAAAKLFKRIGKSGEPRGAVKATQLFLEKSNLPTGVYYEEMTSSVLYFDPRRADLLEANVYLSAGKDLLDFKTAYQKFYYQPKDFSSQNSKADLRQEFKYIKQEADWLFMTVIIYQSLYEDALREKGIRENPNDEKLFIREAFEKLDIEDIERRNIDKINAETLQEITNKQTKNNESAKNYLREFYEKNSVLRDAVEIFQKQNSDKAAKLEEDLRKSPQAKGEDGSPRIQQTSESREKRCTEKDCQSTPLVFENGGWTIIYDSNSADFKALSYEFKLTRLF